MSENVKNGTLFDEINQNYAMEKEQEGEQCQTHGLVALALICITVFHKKYCINMFFYLTFYLANI